MSGFAAPPLTLAALSQWRLDFRVVRQEADPSRREAGLKHLAARWRPRALLSALAGATAAEKEEEEEGGGHRGDNRDRDRDRDNIGERDKGASAAALASEAVGTIEDVLSTAHGRVLWAGASVDVLELVVQGCQGGERGIGEDSAVRGTCARLLQGMLLGGVLNAQHSSRHLLSPGLAASHPALTRAVVDLVASPDADVSSAASNVVLHAAAVVLRAPPGPAEEESAYSNSAASPGAALFQGLVAVLFAARAARMLQDDDATASFRLLDIAARLAGTSERAFREVCDAGLFAALEDTLCDDADDVLLQMTVLEAIGKLARAPYMCRRLVGEGSGGRGGGGGADDADEAAMHLHDMLRDIAGVPRGDGDGDSDGDSDSDGDEENPLVRNGAIRILANVYSTLLGPEEIAPSERTVTLLAGLVEAVEKSLATAIPTSVGVCMQAVRSMASASRVCAFSLLSSTEIVACMVGLCVDREDQRRALGLHTLADLVRGSICAASDGRADVLAAGGAAPDEAGARRAVAMIGEAWLHKTGVRKDTMLVLLDYAKEPLAPTRNGSFDLLAAVAEIPSGWGLRRLFGRSEVHSFLFDRRTETTKEGKEWKFGVLAAAFHCPARETVLGGEEAAAMKQLRAFLQDGPFVARGAGQPAEVVGLHL
jgi:hypothetical protein